MNRITVSIGAGLVTLVYQNVMLDVMLAAVPAVLIACLIVGVSGVRVDLEEWLLPAELLLLGVAFVMHSWVATVVIAIVAVPVLVLLFLAPYPRLPRR